MKLSSLNELPLNKLEKMFLPVRLLAFFIFDMARIFAKCRCIVHKKYSIHKFLYLCYDSNVMMAETAVRQSGKRDENKREKKEEARIM